MLVEVDLLPPLVVQEQPVPVRGDVLGRGDGDVGRVHVGHLASVRRRPQKPVERRERDPGGEEEHGPHPAVSAESTHGDGRGMDQWKASNLYSGIGIDLWRPVISESNATTRGSFCSAAAPPVDERGLRVGVGGGGAGGVGSREEGRMAEIWRRRGGDAKC